MLRMQGRAWQPPRRNWRNRSHMAIVCCESSMSSARSSRAALKRLMERGRSELWLFNWLRSLPHCGKSLNASWEARMGGQKKQKRQERQSPQNDAGARQQRALQKKRRPRRAVPNGGINAQTIQATNVVVGTQIINGSGERSRQRVPLQRPRRAEHFVDREAERARLLADLKAGRVVTVCGLGGMGK